MGTKSGMTRRRFLRRVADIAVGAGLAYAGAIDEARAAQETRPPAEQVRGKMTYRRLGRTGIMVSVIAGSGMPDALYPRAVELGINYWHKLGNWRPTEAITSRPRESFYCDMVIDSLDEEQALQQFEGGLAKSGLEHIDFFKVHSLYRSGDDIKGQPGVLRAFEKLREEGKVRWLAVSQHSRVGEVLSACIESGLFDAIQLPHNPLMAKEVGEVIALAEARDVGVLAMKPLMGGEARWATVGEEVKETLKPYLPDNKSTAQALLRYALAPKGLAAAVPLIRNFEQLEEAVAAVQKPLTRAQMAGLEVLANAVGVGYCRMCGRCEEACPQGVALSHIFRCRMYAGDYGDLDHASRLYASLPADRSASRCDDCGRCEAACPYGRPVVSSLREAHAMLV